MEVWAEVWCIRRRFQNISHEIGRPGALGSFPHVAISGYLRKRPAKWSCRNAEALRDVDIGGRFVGGGKVIHAPEAGEEDRRGARIHTLDRGDLFVTVQFGRSLFKGLTDPSDGVVCISFDTACRGVCGLLYRTSGSMDSQLLHRLRSRAGWRGLINDDLRCLNLCHISLGLSWDSSTAPDWAAVRIKRIGLAHDRFLGFMPTRDYRNFLAIAIADMTKC